jgi:phage antirepressor YoqD-like protein
MFPGLIGQNEVSLFNRFIVSIVKRDSHGGKGGNSPKTPEKDFGLYESKMNSNNQKETTVKIMSKTTRRWIH